MVIWLGDWGFFESVWLGTKQGLMIAIISFGIFSGVGGKMKKMREMAEDYLASGKEADEVIRKQFKQTTLLFDIVHIGVFINFVLAMLKI